ncbi:MAG: GNAT family N-acetyltransferase [Motiliproteus sp.]|nr:GNAT family N-acetyltransferase [Motiliproteus sp.]
MEVCFELTTDPALLQQYYEIRQECFRRELGVRSFDGGEDSYDLTGDILIVRDGDRCVGGVRLTGSTANNPYLLPMECNGFLVLKQFPQIAKSGKGYCQFTRLALLPEYRSMDVMRRLTDAMINVAIDKGYSYVFSISGLNRCRLYRRFFQNAGYDNEILNDVSLKIESGFQGLEHLLSVGYTNSYAERLNSYHYEDRVDQTGLANLVEKPAERGTVSYLHVA